MDLAELLGLGIQNPVSGGDGATTAQFIISIVRNALIVLFAVVTIFAIVYSATAGLKFVTSEGASDKVEEAREAIKNVLIGVGAAFIGVIGVFIISSIFSPNTNAEMSLRCFFGDFYICTVRQVDDLSQCTQSNETAIAIGSSNNSTSVQTQETECPNDRFYCSGTEEISSNNRVPSARCNGDVFEDNVQ